MIKWDKGTNQNTNSTADYIQSMGKEMDIICKMLSEESKEFKAKDFFERIHDYIIQNDRLMYTDISNYIFTLEDQEFGVLQTNIDSVVNYMYGAQYKEDYSAILDGKDKQKKQKLERTQRTVLKFWDHVNLARRQYVLFHHKDDDYEKIVDEKMEVAGAKISKEMNVQLISLVAIFTALSFLVFGGISSLDNIFAGAKDIPILKLVVIGSIWTFCIMNMLFVFIYFVAKISRLNISSTDNVNANIVQKYPLVCWGNLIIILLFVVSSWIMYVKGEGLSEEVYMMFYKHQKVFVLGGTVTILIIAGWLLKKFINIITTQNKSERLKIR